LKWSCDRTLGIAATNVLNRSHNCVLANRTAVLYAALRFRTNPGSVDAGTGDDVRSERSRRQDRRSVEVAGMDERSERISQRFEVPMRLTAPQRGSCAG